MKLSYLQREALEYIFTWSQDQEAAPLDVAHPLTLESLKRKRLISDYADGVILTQLGLRMLGVPPEKCRLYKAVVE